MNKANTPILKAVKQAEERFVAEKKPKVLSSVSKAQPAIRSDVRKRLLLVNDSTPSLPSRLAQTAHTPGGTGALPRQQNSLKNIA